ncbi:hypothetical protein HANVADRAFT_4557 [Hanseniaspora valbyensis NRRL Y-1626]|nr:hypothetical protein HANVADRAFT_4557 [Hanseniaspora valbyensis NRRL Y-1626]
MLSPANVISYKKLLLNSKNQTKILFLKNTYTSSNKKKTSTITASNKALFTGLSKDELLPDSNTPDYVRLTLRSSVYDAIKETPVTEAVNLSQRLNTKVI